jgi:hypothetical protein
MRETRATAGIYNLEMQRIVAKPSPINVRESSACKNQAEQCLFDGFDEGSQLKWSNAQHLLNQILGEFHARNKLPVLQLFFSWPVCSRTFVCWRSLWSSLDERCFAINGLWVQIGISFQRWINTVIEFKGLNRTRRCCFFINWDVSPGFKINSSFVTKK